MAGEDTGLLRERATAIRKSSVLSLVKEKEYEIKAEIVKARQQAAQIVENARLEAEKLISEKKNTAGKEGKALKESIISSAQQEANNVVEKARQQAEDLHRSLKEKTDRAASEVFSIVLGEKEI